jgi:tRNA threonylcarbamoyl adenosine modification protein YeaZ
VLLAIDTSAGTSVAVVDRARVLASRSEEDTRRHAEVIGELIVACLGEADVPVASLSGIAIGMGPGPFTGLRVGIAAAQAFAFGAQRPLLRVVSHDAIAFGHYAQGGSGPFLVVTDARRREVYWSAYSGADAAGLPRRVGAPGLAPEEQLADAVPGYAGYRRSETGWVDAASLGLLAEALDGHRRRFAEPTPLYLRSPDVTVSAGPKRVTR